jgi:two-component system, NarL family, sensor kinase
LRKSQHGKKTIKICVFSHGTLKPAVLILSMNQLTPPRYIAVFLIATILVMTAVLGILMALLLMNQKRHQAFQASLVALKHEHDNKLLRTQIEIQELTFKNIAQEIHDNINLSLTLAKLTLHQIAENGAVAALAGNAQQMISGAINDLSAISRGLNADIIQQQGLFNAIRAEIERIGRSSRVKIEFVINGETEFLSAQLELLLFRSVQECFNNILKHSRAKHVFLCLDYNTEHIRVEVRDDGIGFDPAELPAKKGKSTGLHTLRSRVKLFSGTFTVHSAPGKGAHLIFELPISDPNEKENIHNRAGRRPHSAA